MNPEIKAKWLDALRSGKYAQGYGLLRSGIDKYCCIGVLCDIAEPRGWSGRHGTNCFMHRNKSQFPHTDFCGDLGIPISIVETLIHKNDTDSLSFPQIADWIEANL